METAFLKSFFRPIDIFLHPTVTALTIMQDPTIKSYLLGQAQLKFQSSCESRNVDGRRTTTGDGQGPVTKAYPALADPEPLTAAYL